jgi:hypothetical protein
MFEGFDEFDLEVAETTIHGRCGGGPRFCSGTAYPRRT